ncbi:hypothetical protein L1987_04475 [Smallanthus sonchifolius]|uniref:Uncharacterized protein n=1 Tax=Smallanthus sonchifolius TaxID=185202 RepID=A0ACB9JSP7_9ASTR|nr:hypothetical protein L1987_04475 [Smallanthus sonchifolius]
MDLDDPYHMAWERFNALLSRCLQHSLSDWEIVEKFYNGLTFEKRQMFNTTAGGHIMDKKEPAECEEMFEIFALAEQHRPYTRTSIPSARAPDSSPRGMHQVNPDTSVAVALAAMANEIKELKLNAQMCENRGFNNYNNSYGSGGKSGGNPPGFTARPNQQSGGEVGPSGGSNMNTKRIEEMLETQTQMLAHLDLQRMVEDIAKSLKDRQGDPFSGSNASVMAVSTRIRRVEGREQPPVVEEDEPVDEEIEMEKLIKKAEEKKKGGEMKTPEIDLSRVPYPARLLPHKYAKEYGNFLNMLKQINVNLLFIEVIQHMPKYGKFLKDILSNKKKLEEVSKDSLSERCSAVVQNKLPEKLADPSHFTISCLLGGLPLNHALADLGASVNLMPYFIYKKLDLGEPKPTRMSISLADCSVKYPRGIVENLLVKVEKFVFPMDFFILDKDADDRFPLILGRPFLRTTKALIDIFDGKLTLCVGDEFVTFDAAKSMKEASEQSHSVCMIDAFMDDHRYSDPGETDVGEPDPGFGEPYDWAVDLGELLNESDEYDDKVPSDLQEMMAELEEMIGKTPSLGMIGKLDDPCESLEATSLEIPLPDPLPIIIVPSEVVETESPTKSRPPRKRTRGLSDSCDLRIVQTPSVGTSRGDKLLRMKAVPVRIKEKPPDTLV